MQTVSLEKKILLLRHMLVDFKIFSDTMQLEIYHLTFLQL